MAVMMLRELVVLRLTTAVISTGVAAQSDPADFRFVINAPPSVIDRFTTISGSTQLNVAEDGEVGSSLRVETGSELNVSGGTIDSSLRSDNGSSVNISGGNIGSNVRIGGSASISGGTFGEDLNIQSEAQVQISGGRFQDVETSSALLISGGVFGRNYAASSFFGGSTELTGGEFRINGQPVTTTSLFFGTCDVLTGTLEDGTSFIFESKILDPFWVLEPDSRSSKPICLISSPAPSSSTSH